ncbi:MAG: N-acetylmuramoyl-L-alanine amidase [Verrucomicrobia bacterium]|nr:MAG: N-acetylmuramoyl-L-alanine amidase [Verrucomicrobiota bacterium]
MTRLLYLFSSAVALAVLASCTTLPVVASAGRDDAGRRWGLRGFKTIIIDAGHGGKDFGAPSKSTGQLEKTLTLDTAKRLRAELADSFHTILMRSDDSFVDLDERVARANRYDNAVLVSIHFNSGPRSLRGPETYFWRVDSHGLAVRLQRAMTRISPGPQANRGLVRRRLRLTRNPLIPCVLVEGGYLSNPAEAHLICDPAYRQGLARAIAAAIRTQAAIGDAGTGPLPPPLTSPPSRAGDRRK